MPVSGLLNLGSLVLGLIAWILPVVYLAQHNKTSHSRWAIYSLASAFACAISLCLQIFETNHRVKLQDWSALMDTSHWVTSVAALLLVVTIILNTITLAVYYERQPKD